MSNNLPAIKELAGKTELQARIAGLVENSSAFINTVISLVSADDKLKNCTPESIWGAAMKSAGLNLPVNKVLGQAFIVPFKNQAQLVIGYKGILQLAIRTAKYQTIKATEIYADEVKRFNPITEEFEFSDNFSLKGLRYQDGANPVGYYGFFTMTNGYRATKFMSREQVLIHAKKYSKAYAYDLERGWKNSPWSTDFDEMAKKTLIRLLLTHQGMLSIDVAQADAETAQFSTVDSSPEQESAPGEIPAPETNASDDSVAVPF